MRPTADNSGGTLLWSWVEKSPLIGIEKLHQLSSHMMESGESYKSGALVDTNDSEATKPGVS